MRSLRCLLEDIEAANALLEKRSVQRQLQAGKVSPEDVARAYLGEPHKAADPREVQHLARRVAHLQGPGTDIRSAPKRRDGMLEPGTVLDRDHKATQVAHKTMLKRELDSLANPSLPDNRAISDKRMQVNMGMVDRGTHPYPYDNFLALRPTSVRDAAGDTERHKTRKLNRLLDLLHKSEPRQAVVAKNPNRDTLKPPRH